MKKTAPPQIDLFASPSFDVINDILDQQGSPTLLVIGCGKSKQKNTVKARELYTSKRFKASTTIAENLSSPYLILSGLHGLITPDTEISPYDFDITKQPETYKREWAKKIISALTNINPQKVTILADNTYSDLIIQENNLQSHPLEIRTPFSNIEKHSMQDWLDQALRVSARIKDLKCLYSLINSERASGKIFKLSDLSKANLPARGVYIFIDTNEKNFIGNPIRVVRIGTHAVSLGSKATLRNRLRAHLGKKNGLGNHRASIFRLHVGRALLEKINAKSSTWGVGQDAELSVRLQEEDLEKDVSNYLKDLEILIIPIEDPPSKTSMRALVETQLISLFTEDLYPIDKPSLSWLGLRSPNVEISTTGLWNLRDVGKRYSPSKPGSMDSIKKMLRG